ncbi:hypothetical protein CEXT_345501 [Caerostris extrusa]|uniref:Uncharacterized protein n=1 Tax=Caerostris extrusa TaxID=172846 RepID=A0AAV4R5F1_CAEEX|nr:hypothetical protein CEXT_345501 [Caerostris extrusa]
MTPDIGNATAGSETRGFERRIMAWGLRLEPERVCLLWPPLALSSSHSDTGDSEITVQTAEIEGRLDTAVQKRKTGSQLVLRTMGCATSTLQSTLPWICCNGLESHLLPDCVTIKGVELTELHDVWKPLSWSAVAETLT